MSHAGDTGVGEEAFGSITSTSTASHAALAAMKERVECGGWASCLTWVPSNGVRAADYTTHGSATAYVRLWGIV